MTPRDRADRYMRAQLEHDAWRRHMPQPSPEPRRFADAVTALAVLTLTAGLLYLLLDGVSWPDLRDGVQAVCAALSR